MNKARANRIYACTRRIEEYLDAGRIDEIVYFTSAIRYMLRTDLPEDERKKLDATYQDYFNEDGRVRPVSLIH